MEEPTKARRIQPSQWKLFSLLVIAMLAAAAGWTGREIHTGGTEFWQTGAYFVFIPGTAAAIIALMPWAKGSTSFSVSRASTISILASGILLREGFICILMALPLIVPVISLVTYSTRRSRGHLGILLLPIVLTGIGGEGIVYELPSSISVEETRLLTTNTQSLEASFDRVGQLPSIKPVLFQLPFPQPQSFTGEGASLGATRTVDFGDAGALLLQITERSDNSITWTVAEDSTPLAGWMTLHRFEARWVETPTGVELPVTIEFDRVLSPAFYFGPLERWGVRQLAEVTLDMIEANLEAP